MSKVVNWLSIALIPVYLVIRYSSDPGHSGFSPSTNVPIVLKSPFLKPKLKRQWTAAPDNSGSKISTITRKDSHCRPLGSIMELEDRRLS